MRVIKAIKIMGVTSSRKPNLGRFYWIAFPVFEIRFDVWLTIKIGSWKLCISPFFLFQLLTATPLPRRLRRPWELPHPWWRFCQQHFCSWHWEESGPQRSWASQNWSGAKCERRCTTDIKRRKIRCVPRRNQIVKNKHVTTAAILVNI